MSPVSALFNAPELSIKRLQEIEALADPRRRYIIAITPRSGSSYLCNALKNTKRMGRPQEVLEQSSIAIRLTKNMPGRTPEEYLRNALRVTKTANNVAGLKASWFQFENFIAAMTDRGCLQGFKYIYLTRRDLAAQAVSLYKAVSSNVFHSVATHSEEELAKLETLEYDYEQIKFWYDHIVAQEKGWQRYFYEQRIFPLCMSYEDINEDIERTIKRIGLFTGVDPNRMIFPERISDFQKIGNEQSRQWSLRFAHELALDADDQ